jgi:hypothetical protein
MSTSQRRAYPPPPTDDQERMRAFLANRNQFPADEWLRHVGRHIAMSWDAKAILASDPTFDGLLERLQEIGIGTNEVSFGYVPKDDICYGAQDLEFDYGPATESDVE